MYLIRPRFLGVSATALAVTALTACGSGTTLNHGQVEQLLAKAQQDKSPGLPVTEAQCPSGVAAKVGTKFTCTLKIDGIPVTYNVNVDSVTSNKGHVVFEPANPIIDTGKLSDGIKQAIGAGATADCGARVQQVPINSLIACKASDGTHAETVQFRVVDKDGTVQPVDTGGTSTTTTVAPDSATTVAPDTTTAAP